jgi:sugar/nucleoside kinase (ribokinase family)
MVRFVFIGGITLDDIVSPTGQALLAQSGGNAVYSAIGARIWCDEALGIVSRVGSDYPQEYLDRLRAGGMDLSGAERIDGRSVRLWLLYEEDGRRQVIPRLDSGLAENDSEPAPLRIPSKFLSAQFAHVSGMSVATQQELALRLTAYGLPFSLDISPMARLIDLSAAADSAALKRCQLFLPSIDDVELIWGRMPLLRLLERIASTGPGVIAVKMGADGSVVHDARRHETVHVPAVPVDAVDPTGAGDAYCGGFVVGYCQSGNALEAALMAAVSASFVIEGFGALHALDVDHGEARRRLNDLRKRVRRVEG